MRSLKLLAVVIFLAMPALAYADASDVPGSANWYFYVDLKQMNEEDAGKSVYSWLKEEVFQDVKEEVGVDLENELDRITSFNIRGEGPIIVFDGKLTQATKDKIMTFVASGGDIQPLKSSGKTYFHFGGDENADDDVTYGNGNIRFKVDSLGEESWISMALKNKLVITSSEPQMKNLLAKNGKIAGARSHDGALMVLTAEKTLVQAGMNAGAFDEDDDSDWDSNILRNTEQVAFLVAAAADKLAIEAKLVTKGPEMAESLASVVRGLIGLAAFSDDMDEDVIAALRGMKVKSNGNSLSISLAVDPDLVVATLSD